MIRNTLILLFIPLIFLSYSPAFCARAYITDTFRISLRRGPSIENKILKFLPSGMPVEIIESTEDGWSQVRLISPKQNNLTGWVLSRYLIHRLPWATQTQNLKQAMEKSEAESGSIEERLKKISISRADLAARLEETQGALNKTTHQYERLQTESKDYIDLKKRHQITLADMEKLKQRCDELERSTNLQFFGLGSLVLLFGLLIGTMMGKGKKKQSSYI